jgi:hypothetical protein
MAMFPSVTAVSTGLLLARLVF